MCIYIELVCFLIAAIVPRSNNPLSFRHMALFQLTLLVSFGMEAGGTLHYKLDAIGGFTDIGNGAAVKNQVIKDSP